MDIRLRCVSTLVAASVLLLVSCTSSGGTPQAQTAKPTGPVEVVVGVPSEAAIIDPHQRANPGDRIITSMLFDNLLMPQYPSETPGPGLAESWDVAADGMSVTLHLRKLVKFQDGTPFNADAVKFSLDRQLDPTNDFYKLGKFPLAAGFTGNIKMPLEVVDDSTVRVNFKAKVAPDINLEYFTTDSFAIVSPTAVKNAGAKFPDKPIGTGPFRFVSWDK